MTPTTTSSAGDSALRSLQEVAMDAEHAAPMEQKTCPYDSTIGIFDWSCYECRARWLRKEPARLQPAILKAWATTMPAAELAEVKRRIGESAVEAGR